MANALGPVLGIMCTDYYIIRRRKLNVEALYMRNGQYSYWKEWNPAAIVSLVISFAASLLVRIDFGFFVGLPISVVLYYLLMKFWIIPKYPQEELSEGYQPNYTFDGTQS